MRTTFLNGDKKLKERGLNSLQSLAEDMDYYMNYSSCEDVDDLKEQLRRIGADFSTIRKRLRQFEDLPIYYEYGLSFDYVELGTFDDMKEDYFRYQFSWGGPSDELRFYEDRIEYVFMDWFCGVGFDVSNEEWAEWCKLDFKGMGMLDFQEKREKYDYYEQLYALEEKEEDE